MYGILLCFQIPLIANGTMIISIHQIPNHTPGMKYVIAVIIVTETYNVMFITLLIALRTYIYIYGTRMKIGIISSVWS